jgi:O-antigen ligase
MQVTAEGGLVGLILFCFWYFGYIYLSFKNAKHSRLATILGQSLLAIGIAGMTQNAFQDSEVRHVIMILIVLFWCNHGRIVMSMRKSSTQNKNLKTPSTRVDGVL